VAAHTLICRGCGSKFVALRSHRRWCSERCRKATSRATQTSPLPPIDLAERAWLAADGDGCLALLAALAVIERVEQQRQMSEAA
jgi:hypothetical protein